MILSVPLVVAHVLMSPPLQTQLRPMTMVTFIEQTDNPVRVSAERLDGPRPDDTFYSKPNLLTVAYPVIASGRAYLGVPFGKYTLEDQSD
jgi:hypothetical protein